MQLTVQINMFSLKNAEMLGPKGLLQLLAAFVRRHKSAFDSKITEVAELTMTKYPSN